MKAVGGISFGSAQYPATLPPSAALPSFPDVVMGGDAVATEIAEHVGQAEALSCGQRLVTGSGSYLDGIDDWQVDVLAMTG